MMFLTNLSANQGEPCEQIYLKISLFIKNIFEGYFYKQKIIASGLKLLTNIAHQSLVAQVTISSSLYTTMLNQLLGKNNKNIDVILIRSIISIFCNTLNNPHLFEMFYSVFSPSI